MRAASWDLDARVQERAGEQVGYEVVSPMPELFCYWAPPREAVDYCRCVNSWIATETKRRADRFQGFGIVPLQDVDLACALLREIREEGLVGVEVGSHIGGTSIADPRYFPFYAEAERLGLVIFVHAFHPELRSLQFSDDRLAAALSFPSEIGFCLLAVIASGVMDMTKGLRLLFSHGGGSAPYTIDRLVWLWETNDQVREQITSRPDAYLQRIYVDNLVFGAAPLRYLIDKVGPEHVVLGSDYPFITAPIGNTLTEANLDCAMVKAIQENNARQFLKGRDKA